MAVTNAYCTVEELMGALGIKDTRDQVDLEASIDTASRQLDSMCGKGRKFWQDATVVARTYYAEDDEVWVDDISTTTGLIVKADLDDDGTFETTLTINTDFIVTPVNAAKEYPVRPYEKLVFLMDGAIGSIAENASGRPNIQVTAKFGWPTVPDAVQRACVLQARHVFKAAQSQNGLVQLAVDGSAIRMPLLDPMARLSIEPYIRYTPVNDEDCDE